MMIESQTLQDHPLGLSDRLRVDRLPLAYILLDADYRVRDWNPAAEKLFGYSKDEALGRSGLELIVPLPLTCHLQETLRRIQSGDMQAHSVNENRTKDGRLITCQWHNTPLVESDGRYRGVLCLAQDITERIRVEQLRENDAARLRTLSRRLVHVQEEERRHLSRELHDEIGQMLTGLRFLLKTNGDTSREVVESQFEQARGMVAEILEKVRGLSADLRPVVLDHLGLVPALITLFERYSFQTQVSVDFKHRGVEGRFVPEVEMTAYRIVQEALTNVARHADVDQVAVRVWTTADRLSVQIEDRGHGFDPEAALSNPRTGGLTGMQERVKLLAGQLTIESRPGEGTQIAAELPCVGPLKVQ
jgi:PAS domain S-box-containing protein